MLILLSLIPAGILMSQEKSSKEYMEAIKREENVMEKLRKEITQNEKEWKELSKKESDVMAEIYHIEKKIDLSRQLVTELKTDLKLKQGELENLDNRIGAVRGDLGLRQEDFNSRLREFYKMRRVNPLEVVFGSSSFATAFRRIYYMTLVADQDRAKIADYTALTVELGASRDERKEKITEIAARKDEVEEEKAELERSEKKKEQLHASVKKQKLDREQAIEKLKQETKRLDSLIGDIEKKRLVAVERERMGTYNLDKAIGMLRWPVEGSVLGVFGRQFNSDLGTVVESKGIDIKAAKGASVYAVAPGRVEFTDWWQSYGKMVIVSHGNGFYTLYAHLSRILMSVGKDVKEGDAIAEVGDTGSLSGPYLHFEIRRGREAVNPLTYLRKK